MDVNDLNMLIQIVERECAERGLKVSIVSESRRQTYFSMLDSVGGEELLTRSYNMAGGEKPEVRVKVIGDRELAADIFVMLKEKSRKARRETGEGLKWELDYKSV